jgi:hypothetical protein
MCFVNCMSIRRAVPRIGCGDANRVIQLCAGAFAVCSLSLIRHDVRAVIRLHGDRQPATVAGAKSPAPWASPKQTCFPKWSAMLDVLEFDNARMPLHLLLLRGAGLPDPTRWRVERGPNLRYEDGILTGCPRLVACDRLGGLCVAHLMPGEAPSQLPQVCLTHGALDAALVYNRLTWRGASIKRITLWWAFDDGGHLEKGLPLRACAPLLEQARRLARAQGVLPADTASIASLLPCSMLE